MANTQPGEGGGGGSLSSDSVFLTPKPLPEECKKTRQARQTRTASGGSILVFRLSTGVFLLLEPLNEGGGRLAHLLRVRRQDAQGFGGAGVIVPGQDYVILHDVVLIERSQHLWDLQQYGASVVILPPSSGQGEGLIKWHTFNHTLNLTIYLPSPVSPPVVPSVTHATSTLSFL
jgi:hypothetical protein